MGYIQRTVSDDCTVISQVVVWVQNGVTTPASDIVDGRLEVTQIGRVEGTSQPSRGRAHTLHGKGNTERVEALAEEIVEGRSCWLLSINKVTILISYTESLRYLFEEDKIVVRTQT